ncbi:VWA domain-containing protein [Chloroflexota bacterium]
MKTRGLIVALILMIALGTALPAWSQGVVSLSIDELQFDNFPQSAVLVTVRNENGVPITGLTADQFEIVEDGRTSYPPSGAESQVNPDAGISVMMVIDISGSMKGKPIKEAMRAANALIDQLSPQDRAAIIAFADEVNTDPGVLEEGKEVGFTTDKNALRNVVNFLDTKIGWDTPLYDAIYKGVKMVAAEPPGKRAVVVLTDGRDERDNKQGVAVKDAGSLSVPDDPINEANRHNIPIFSVGLEGIGGKIDTKYLSRLAERTGGVYQRAPEPEELTPLFENVANELKQQYTLTYDSRLPENDEYHSLLVRVQLPQGHAFSETKFQIRPVEGQDTTAAAPAVPAEATAPASAGSSQLPSTSQVASQGTEQSGFSGIIDTIKRLIDERPLLAVVIGAGLLLLLILVIVLVVVLLRGRGAGEEEFVSEELDLTYAPGGEWSPGPTAPRPVVGAPPDGATEVGLGGQTEMASDDWFGAATGEPTADQPPPGVEGGLGIPAAGGTRIIERAPKQLAMLVDKAHPDQRYDLKGTINIGRGTENQIALDDPTVSRQHAWIKADGEDFLVFDVGSGNGTFVNDERVTEPRRLENGDLIRFGEAEFVFTRVF